MAYNPNLYNHYGQQPSWIPTPAVAAQQPINGFVRASGKEGAAAFAMPPNSSMPIFDDTENILYIKTTDAAGFQTIKECDVIPRDSAKTDSKDGPVTRAEFESLKRQVEQLASQRPRNRKKEGYNEQSVSTE